jgi:threonine dehydrogenase-like Zn-dependent dehydrogenase
MHGPGRTRFALPHIPGHEYCGIVVEAGPEVRGWRRGRPGDRALHPRLRDLRRLPGREPDDLCDAGRAGLHLRRAFAERVAVAHADANLTRLPEGMDPRWPPRWAAG